MWVRIRDELTCRFPRAMWNCIGIAILAAVMIYVLILTVIAILSPSEETIGSRLKRRVQLAVSLCICGLSLCLIAFTWPNSGPVDRAIAITLAGGACMTFFVGLYSCVTVECPKCEIPISPRIVAKPPLKRCPHCRVRFDAPYPLG